MGIFSAESRVGHSSVLLLSLVLAIAPCAGVAIRCSEESIRAGDRVVVHLQGLENGSVFSIAMEGRFVSGTDGSFRLAISGFTLPISLSGGNVEVSSWNTVWMKFDARKGATTVSVSGEPAGGEIRMCESQDLGAGMYEMLKIEGIALDRGSGVNTSIRFTGTKTGPDNFDIGFTVDELTGGELQVIGYVDSVEVMNHRLLLVTDGSDESNARILLSCPGKRWISTRIGRAGAFAVEKIQEMSHGPAAATAEIPASATVHVRHHSRC